MRAHTGPTRHAARGARLLICFALVSVLIGSAVVVSAPAGALAASPAAPPVVFPGPASGTPGSQTPRASDFVRGCNAYLNDSGKVGGRTIAAGTAIMAPSGCGVATLLLAASGPGHFQATFGVSDDDTSGQPAIVNVQVVGRDGNNLRTSRFTASRGSASPIDVDVSNATAVLLRFSSAAKIFAYDFRLTGAVRLLQPASGSGGAPPAGASPVNIAGAARSCNAYAITSPLTVTQVSIPAAGSVTGTSCGQVTISVTPGIKGTLALRFGVDDTSTGGVSTLTASVLGVDGRLLRKATGATFLGAGLRPLWVDLGKGSTVVLTFGGSTDSHLVVTAAGILPRALPVYSIPDRTFSGGSPGGSVLINPDAFVSKCNSYLGTQDITVGRVPVFATTYLSTDSCGAASLLFCCTNAVGIFHAQFGVPDTTGAGAPPSVTVLVQNRNGDVLRRATVHATYGAVGAHIDMNIKNASVISFAFSGNGGVLYNLRLTGTATISELIYPPTVPPTDPAGGVAVYPSDFALSCNAYLTTDDVRLVGATTLKGWALSGESCGAASLPLARTHYPRNHFYARVGIALGESPDTVVTVRFNVLNAAGKVLRHKDVLARYGYGPQPVRLSVAGGATVQILWLTSSHSLSNTVVYAMTAS